MDILLQSLFVFLMTLLVNVLYTVRLLVILKGQRIVGTAIAFIESFAFAFSFSRVLGDLSSWPLLIAYCLGTSAGSYVGMIIEERFVIGHVRIKIIVPSGGEKIAATLRDEGYEVMQSFGAGQQGMVTLLQSVVARRDADHLMQLVETVNPKAFITVEEQNVVRRMLRTPSKG